jgi:3-deoxy-D-manno-octulosonic-acid transferase
VRREVPCALLIAPRRLERAAEIEELIQARGLKTNRRSQWMAAKSASTAPQSSATSAASTDTIYILDTLGELATVYRFGTASFVGGTLYEIGHNVVEPLVYGIPCAFGLGNGRDNAARHMRDICRDAGAGFEVTTPAQLAAHWRAVATQPELREQLRERAAQLLEQHSGAASVTLTP